MNNDEVIEALQARAHRAFADAEALRTERVPRLERIRWIGRKLTLAARTSEGFQEGREIVAAAEALLICLDGLTGLPELPRAQT